MSDCLKTDMHVCVCNVVIVTTKGNNGGVIINNETGQEKNKGKRELK